MKHTIITLALLVATITYGQANFYDLTAKTIDGEELSFEQFKGKKVLIVNVASKCGLTPQYEELETLFKMYGGDKFTIIGFPANDFMKQEPGSEEEIKTFCETNYGVTFQMMSKISVKGDDMHPVYQWLTQKNKNSVEDTEVKWNFQKYLIAANGTYVEMFTPRTKPLSEEIVNQIKK